MTRKNKGVFLGMLGTCSYGTNPLFALPLYAVGMDELRFVLSLSDRRCFIRSVGSFP